MFRIKCCKTLATKLIFDSVILPKPLQSQQLLFARSVTNQPAAVPSDVENDPKHVVQNIPRNPKSSERAFLIRLKNDPDIFGKHLEKEVLDEGDVLEEKHFAEQASPHKKLSTKQYANIIKDLIKKRKIKEAIDVIEVRMLKEDKVKPENYLYNLIFGALGRVGYTKKAFSMFNDMKKRGLKVHPGAYTALFNACANSPFPEDSLKRAHHLRELMIEKRYEPNSTNYNAMIKAFGRCGDLNTAFSIVDEMQKRNFEIKDDTINFLLQACISDKESGFRHALLVWRKLIERNIQPSVHTYNLMLKCVRECGLGDIETTQDVINRLVGNSYQLQSSEKSLIEGNINDTSQNKLIINSIEDDEISNKLSLLSVPESEVKIVECNERSSVPNLDHLRPNLMADKPHLGNIISLSEVIKPEDRLLLLGGYKGFVKNMEEHKCSPDIKTFTQLLEALPNTTILENELLTFMKDTGVVADIDFFNMLIKKRSLRGDYEAAKEVMKVLRKMKYKPDIITYGVLALACKTKYEAEELIEEMKEHKYMLNAQILGAMVHTACRNGDYEFIEYIMDLCTAENVQLNKKFLRHLETFLKLCGRKMDKKELQKKQEKRFGEFRRKYRTWLTQIQMDETEEKHPWDQFQQNTEHNHDFKWNDGIRFKPIRASRFKVKTSQKQGR